MRNNRRDFIKKGASYAAVLSFAGLSSCSESEKTDNKKNTKTNTLGLNEKRKVVDWPIIEGPTTPKLCVNISLNADEAEIQRVKQMGIDNVLIVSLKTPWKQNDLRAIIDRFKAAGLSIMNMYINVPQNTIRGKEGRDYEIAVIKESIIAAGTVGLPVVEYNFYVHRFMEGYYEKKGRGGSGITAFDYSRVKDLPVKSEIETYTTNQLWDNLTYFLKEVIPVAEKAAVRMALHPNDPGVPISHGSAQIIATFDDWKRLINLIDSPSNGMTYDCGVSREMGYDPLEIFRYLRSRDRVNHIHFRNVTVQEPHVKYEEVFFDVGVVNMFAVMQEIIKSGYKFGIYPEHQRLFINDNKEERGYPGGGGYTGLVYNVAYSRAMMQAVLSL